MKEQLIPLGMLLVFIGFALILIGGISSMISGQKTTNGETQVKGGGVVFIGPIPIIFGTDTSSVKTILFLTIFMIILVYFLFYRRVL